MTWRPELHPRDPNGEFAGNNWAARLAGAIGGLFDTFVDPAFAGPSDSAIEHAGVWARHHMNYTDTTTGYRSEVVGLEHGGDGITVSGVFKDGETEIGHWGFSVLKDEDGRRVGTVDGIYLDSDRRGEGLAKRWNQRLETALRIEGVQRVSMWDHSQGFWASQGYTPGERANESVKKL